jgi:hypothetical protein
MFHTITVHVGHEVQFKLLIFTDNPQDRSPKTSETKRITKTAQRKRRYFDDDDEEEEDEEESSTQDAEAAKSINKAVLVPQRNADRLENYLNFFEAAEYFQLLGPINTLYEHVIATQLGDLGEHHMHIVLKLWKDHPVSQAVHDLLAKEYITSNYMLGPKSLHFRFQRLYQENDTFAAQLGRSTTKLFRGKQYTRNYYRANTTVGDQEFTIKGTGFEVVAKREKYTKGGFKEEKKRHSPGSKRARHY